MCLLFNFDIWCAMPDQAVTDNNPEYRWTVKIRSFREAHDPFRLKGQIG